MWQPCARCSRRASAAGTCRRRGRQSGWWRWPSWRKSRWSSWTTCACPHQRSCRWACEDAVWSVASAVRGASRLMDVPPQRSGSRPGRGWAAPWAAHSTRRVACPAPLTTSHRLSPARATRIRRWHGDRTMPPGSTRGRRLPRRHVRVRVPGLGAALLSTAGSGRRTLLRTYATRLDAVELNNTFYVKPSAERRRRLAGGDTRGLPVLRQGPAGGRMARPAGRSA